MRGTVVDATAQAVPERGFTRAAQVGAAGEFAIPLVPPGVYHLAVEAARFATEVLEGVEVRVGAVVTLTVEMSLGAVATEVIATAEAAAVEVERTQQSKTVEQRSITALPTQTLADDASFRSIQTPNSGLSFGGSNGRGNGFFIDGLENYGVSGGVRPTFSQEAAQEFQIAIGVSPLYSFTALPDHLMY